MLPQIGESFFLTVGTNLFQLSSLTVYAWAYLRHVHSELIQRILGKGHPKASNYYSVSHSAVMKCIANRYLRGKKKSKDHLKFPKRFGTEVKPGSKPIIHLRYQICCWILQGNWREGATFSLSPKLSVHPMCPQVQNNTLPRREARCTTDKRSSTRQNSIPLASCELSTEARYKPILIEKFYCSSSNITKIAPNQLHVTPHIENLNLFSDVKIRCTDNSVDIW
jgi:hypothetical protein